MQLDLRTVPYDNFGITLWSVEDRNGFCYFYCDTKKQAEEKIKTAQNNLDKFASIRNDSF